MHVKNDPIPAVAYLRRSTDRQEQSLGDQRSEIARFAAENGYRLVREYMDDAISGTTADERPGFQRMITDAKTGTFKAVVVWNSDRFSRGDVTETEHYRYLLRRAGVGLVSVTEGYLNREGIDADVLRTVKQFQNRQFSISLSQNTLRGQISSVKSASDPGRPTPYGYDREIVGPDGSVLYRVRFCPGRVREVVTKDGTLQARYQKGQSLEKPGKECRARLVLSDPVRVQAVKDIFAMCVEGRGFRGITDELNRRGLPSPRGELWAFTTIKAILENPTYRGDIVWNRRTEAKFYTVQNGRADQMRSSLESARIEKMPQEQWLVVPDAVPAIVDRETWHQAQKMAKKRSEARGGRGHQTNRWLLSGVLRCGDCGHIYWGENKPKGHVEGRKPVFTKYYTCSGRRSHGTTVCAASSHIPAPALETWVLGKLNHLVLADLPGVEAGVDRFIEAALGQTSGAPDIDALARQLREVDATVKALIMHIDPANLSLLNDRLTQLRLRRENIEREIADAKTAVQQVDERGLRKWATEQLTGLREVLDGRRDEKARKVIAAYVERIVVTPSAKTGVLELNPGAYGLYNANDRPVGRSCAKEVVCT